jgi:hypothetical protein
VQIRANKQKHEYSGDTYVCTVPVAKCGMELDDEVVLLLGDVPPLHPVSEVVDPPQPAALAAPQQP